MEYGIIFILLLVLLYSLIAKKLDRYSITMPIVLVLGGALGGSHLLGVFNFSITLPAVEHLTEICLALLLFADAASLNFQRVREDAGLPGRLLLIGLALMILLGGIAAMLITPGALPAIAFLLACILAPTDAALGLPIFNNPLVPVRIRRALNVESGLNDGIVAPIVTLMLSLVVAEETSQTQGWLTEALLELLIGVGFGAAIGWSGGQLYRWSLAHKMTRQTWVMIGNLALALLAYFGSQAFGGNGFIAAFTGGILFGYASRDRLHASTEFTGLAGTTLSIFVWVLFGSTMVVPLFQNFDPLALWYAILNLTLLRMISVAVALWGKHFRWDTVLMMGWLGPRGLASVVFLIITMDTLLEIGPLPSTLVQAAAWTILLSVLLHGLTALPLATWYARRLSSLSPQAPELVEVEEVKVRSIEVSHPAPSSREQAQPNNSRD